MPKKIIIVFPGFGILPKEYDEILPKNIHKVHLDIWTDDELKNIYSQAFLSIIPIKNSYQPSGQSVALQSMSMEVPVMITDTIGFWDKETFSHNENIFFIPKNTSKIWIENIILLPGPKLSFLY